MPDAAPKHDVPGAVGSVLLTGIGIAVLWVSGDYSTLGSVFPRAIGGLLVALGILYLALVLLGRTRRAPPAEGSNLRRVGVGVVMLAWAFALGPLGYLGSSALAFALLLVIANHHRWTPRSALAYGAVGALVLGASYALFKIALLVPLP